MIEANGRCGGLLEDIDLGWTSNTQYTAWPQRVHLKLFNGNTFKLPRTLSNIPTRGLLTSNLSRRNWSGMEIWWKRRVEARCARARAWEGEPERRTSAKRRGIQGGGKVEKPGRGTLNLDYFCILLLILQLFVMAQFPIVISTQQC